MIYLVDVEPSATHTIARATLAEVMMMPSNLSERCQNGTFHGHVAADPVRSPKLRTELSR